jgi:hypothetical protein
MMVRLVVAGKQKARALQSDGISSHCRKQRHSQCAVLRCRCTCHAAVFKPITRCHARALE